MGHFMWDLSSPPGIKPTPLQEKHRVATTGLPGKSQTSYFNEFMWVTSLYVNIQSVSLFSTFFFEFKDKFKYVHLYISEAES